MIEIFFLGTAGSAPTTSQNLPAIALRIEGEIILLDAGEDIQRRYIQAGLGLNKKVTVLISHMHADHVIGLPGMLYRFAMAERTAPIEIYGPTALETYLRAVAQSLGLPQLALKLFSISLPQGTSKIEHLISTKHFSVQFFRVDHRIEPAFGFKVIEATKPGKFYPERARALNVPEGRLWGQLQKGETVKSTTGDIIYPHQVLGDPRPGVSIVYSGDTRPCKNVLQASKNATVLIHEATFLDEHHAKERGHTSAGEAARLAKQAGVKYLILTHFSNRHAKELEILLDTAKAIFPQTILAEDLLYLQVTGHSCTDISGDGDTLCESYPAP
ncbi:MAG: ribonuclease Z [Candidatus Hodarchaeota archaeon]